MPARGSRRASPVSSEFGLIRRLQAQAAKPDRQVALGIGDDTAILKTSPTEWTLMTTDLLAEGVHFDLATSSCEDIGYRAAIANLSDIAAMGGTPRFMLVAIAIPSTCSTTQIQQLYRGMMQASAPYQVCLVGGDTSASKHGLFLSITLTGVVRPGHALLRSEARVGDRLYVTGTLGDSRAGLGLLSSRRQHSFASTHRRFLLARHHRPSARIAEGRNVYDAGFEIVSLAYGQRRATLFQRIGACNETPLLCDLLAQVLLRPAVLPVGVVTACIGAPFFVALLLSRGLRARLWS